MLLRQNYFFERSCMSKKKDAEVVTDEKLTLEFPSIKERYGIDANPEERQRIWAKYWDQLNLHKGDQVKQEQKMETKLDDIFQGNLDQKSKKRELKRKQRKQGRGR